MISSSYCHCLTLPLLLVPPLIFGTYLLIAFPSPPKTLNLHPSLASLPRTAKSWQIYPEDFYEGGSYVSFPHGRTRYWLLGPEKGKKVVLIHGLSIPAIVWKDIALRLAAHGYRVLLYDLYGRGYSDAPETTGIKPALWARLWNVQRVLSGPTVLTVSARVLPQGGGIAAAFTAHFPHLVDEGVVLIASAGLIENSDISCTVKFMSSPLVQSVASSVPYRKYLQCLTNTTSTTGDDQLNLMAELVRVQSAHLPGFNAAVSSSLRDGPIGGQAAMFASSGFKGKKVLVIQGTKDVTVHPKYAPRIIELLPEETRKSARLVTVEDAGHEIVLTHAELVTDEMMNFLEAKH